MADDVTVDLTREQKIILSALGGLVVVLGIGAALFTSGDDGDDVVVDAVAEASTSTTQAIDEKTTTTATPGDGEGGQAGETAGSDGATATTVADETSTSVSDETSTTAAGATSTTTGVDEAQTFDTSGLIGESVFDDESGVQLVRYAEDQDEIDCVEGTLVAERDGAIVHVYDLPFAGGITAYAGPGSQTAIVGNCEESITFVQLASQDIDETGTPDFAPVVIPEDVFFLDNFGWVPGVGVFEADGLFSDGSSPGTTERVIIDPESNAIVPVVGSLGRRVELPLVGVDFVVPVEWEEQYVDDEVAEYGTSNGVLLTITSFPEDGPIEAFDVFNGETIDSSFSGETTVWTGDQDGAAAADSAPLNEALLVGPDGSRFVRSIFYDGRSVEIEISMPANAPLNEQAIGRWMTDLVRVFDAVG